MEVKVDLIPKGRKRRPSTKMKAQYITIHNTGCANVPADNFRRSVLDPTQDEEVSWHYTIDEKEVIQHIPINEVAWHAGSRDGNYTSIGIEICERDGAEENAINFVAQLCRELGFTTKQIRTHKSWSGKQCPHLILPHWDKFIANVEKELNAPTKLNWKQEVINRVCTKYGLENDTWTPKWKDDLTVGDFFAIIEKITK